MVVSPSLNPVAVCTWLVPLTPVGSCFISWNSDRCLRKELVFIILGITTPCAPLFLAIIHKLCSRLLPVRMYLRDRQASRGRQDCCRHAKAFCGGTRVGSGRVGDQLAGHRHTLLWINITVFCVRTSSDSTTYSGISKYSHLSAAVMCHSEPRTDILTSRIALLQPGTS